MAIKIQLRRLPKELRKEGLEEKIAEICQKITSYLWLSSALLQRGNKAEKAT